MTTDPGWQVPPAVIDGDVAEVIEAAHPYEQKRIHWASFEEKLTQADKATLHLYMNGGTGEIQ